ncbi:MAG: TlpA family protein disulfide reductase [Eubacterium sp.]|nr:TlpA family protein disulfide reductase [Eubacterium sp.]
MNKWFQKASALLAGMICITMMGGCASAQKAPENVSQPASEADGQAETDADKAELVQPEEGQQAEDGASGLGEFSVQDITGKEYTNEMFRDYKLTMVNVFTTWCTPCINEIPDLEKLHIQMADKGVNVVGIVLDAVGEKGERDEEAIEKAKLLAERTGASYPFLIPDAGGMNGRLYGIQAVPETFFVDKDGRILGETYTGSNVLEEWKKIVEAQLDSLEGEQQ